MMRNLTSIVVFLLGCIAVFAADEPLLEAVKADKNFQFDGKLDEAFWKDAKSYGDFCFFGFNGKKTNNTEIKIAYDDTWLYIGAECKNKDMGILEPKFKNNADAINRDDSVEIFLDPGTSGKTYFHYILSYNNLHSGKVKKTESKSPGSSLQCLSAVSKRKDGWSAEIAIPLYQIISQGSWNSIRMNFARNERCPMIDSQGVLISEKINSYVFSPVISSFHEPKSFVNLKPIEPGKIQTPLLASVKGVKISPYETKENKISYTVSVEIAGAFPNSGELELEVKDIPVNGAASVINKKFTKKGTTPNKVIIPINVNTPCERNLEVALKNPQNRMVMEKVVVENPDVLNVMSGYLDRNYYTTEKDANVMIELALPNETLNDMELAINNGGKIVAKSSATARSYLNFPVDTIKTGTHKIIVELRKKNGGVFFSYNLTLLKREPKPGHEWKIDKFNRCLLDNGKPFVHLSMSAYSGNYKKEEDFKRLKDHAFNTYFHWTTDVNPDIGAEYGRIAQKYGLMFSYFVESPAISPVKLPGFMDSQIMKDFFAALPPANVQIIKATYFLKYGVTAFKIMLCLYGSNVDSERIFGEYYHANLEQILKGVEKVKNLENLSNYLYFEEPAPFMFKSMCELYGKINDMDGYHPVITLFSGTPPPTVSKLNITDVMMQDPYWRPYTSGYRSSPRYVAGEVVNLMKLGAGKGSPVWVTVANETFRGAYTTEELEAQTWLALINGATGINYFDDKTVRAETWVTHKKLNQMIKKLTPAIVGSTVEQTIVYQNGRMNAAGQVRYQDVECQPEKDKFPDVQAILKKSADGKFLLLAANCFNRPAKVKFTIAGMEGAECRFSGRKMEVEKNSFEESLKGYAICAYSLTMADVKGAVKITVASQVSEKEMLKQEYVMPDDHCRKGVKNLIHNPSFEQAKVAGYPDFFYLYNQVPFGYMIGEEKQALGQVSNEHYHGKYSLFLSKSPECPNANMLMFEAYPQNDVPTDYTFSFYAKADKPGLKLQFTIFPYAKETFTLSTEWKRYSLLMKVPAHVKSENCRFMLSNNGRIWLDALQLEKGDTMTDFQE